MPLPVGTLIAGRYEVVSLVGLGGMGEVYRAKDHRLGREVAIKGIPGHLASDSRLWSRFEREAKALASLSHPNILDIHDFIKDNRDYFVVTELLQGETLRNQLKNGPLPWKEAARIGIEIAEGLIAAHSNRVVHRDLKPENIFITSRKHVKILDFGLAGYTETMTEGNTGTTISRQTNPGSVLGTLPYMSPEQLRGETVDTRSDIFSFGAILYEMLTAQMLFQRQTGSETIAAILKENPADLAIIPAQLSPVITQCLEKHPDERFQTAQGVAVTLKAILNSDLLVSDAQKKGPNREPTVAAHAPDSDSIPAGSSAFSRKSPGVSKKLRITISAIVVVLVTAFMFYFGRKSPPPSAAGKITIAVLPFTNMSTDKEQEYFSDGLSEDLLNKLAKNPKLQVTSRTSAFSFKGKELDIKTIAGKLEVTHVLEGSVRKSGNHLRITAQLIEVATDSQLWSQSYDRRMENIFAIQDDIAASVAGALKVTLEGGETPKGQPKNAEAYKAYLQGQYFLDRRTKEDYEKAIDYYEKALLIDPDYAHAWAGLSAAHELQADRGYVPLHEGYAKARKEAEKALEFDPNLAVAHARIGSIKRNYDWDWTGADFAYKRALQLESANPDVLLGAAALARTLGRFEEAITLDSRAVELDPLSIAAYTSLGIHLYLAGHWGEAEAAYRKALELNPMYPGTRMRLAVINLARSKPNDALAEIQQEPEPVLRAYGLALVYHAAARKKEADAALLGFIEKYQDEMAYQIAMIYSFREEMDKAFEWLERAYKRRDTGMVAIKGGPLKDRLRHDPRYPAYLRKMNLPPD